MLWVLKRTIRLDGTRRQKNDKLVDKEIFKSIRYFLYQELMLYLDILSPLYTLENQCTRTAQSSHDGLQSTSAHNSVPTFCSCK